MVLPVQHCHQGGDWAIRTVRFGASDTQIHIHTNTFIQRQTDEIEEDKWGVRKATQVRVGRVKGCSISKLI